MNYIWYAPSQYYNYSYNVIEEKIRLILKDRFQKRKDIEFSRSYNILLVFISAYPILKENLVEKFTLILIVTSHSTFFFKTKAAERRKITREW